MKKTIASSLLLAAAALLLFVSPARAGVLVIEDGPTFSPDTAFSENTLMVDSTVGEGALIHVTGGATVFTDVTDVAMISLSGTFSASAGDIFSGAYSFSADLNSDTPVDYTISGLATILGVPVEFTATGTITPGLHRYGGTFAAPVAFPMGDAGNFSATFTLDFSGSGAQAAADPGTLGLAIEQVDFKLDPLIASLITPSIVQNVSTRANVGLDDNVLIGGFIITGSDPKQVVLRGLGPSLVLQEVTGVLQDPVLELHDSTNAQIAMNDNWMDLSAEDQMVLADHNLTPTEDSESAIVMTLNPGPYTFIVRGANNTTGVALVEGYDVDDGTTDSQFANVSTRGFVETGEGNMIGGFILGAGGGGLTTMVVRAIGPSLSDDDITDPLADPFLELHNGDGDVIDSNDNWMDDPNMQQVSDAGLAPTDPAESALYKILSPGGYTAVVTGVGDTTGVALVESYNLDSPSAGPGR